MKIKVTEMYAERCRNTGMCNPFDHSLLILPLQQENQSRTCENVLLQKARGLYRLTLSDITSKYHTVPCLKLLTYKQ
jgi:hypothetical protein